MANPNQPLRPILSSSRLNLPPLVVDEEGRISQTSLDHFTHTIQQWGHEIDTQHQQMQADMVDLETRITALENP